MKFVLTLEDTREGVFVSLDGGHNGQQDNPAVSLSALHMARFMAELRDLRDKHLINSNPIELA